MAGEEAVVVPVIDLSKFPGELKKLAAASTEVGCFQITNHGIPASLLAKMKETFRPLFDIPIEVKQRNVSPGLVDGLYNANNFSPNGYYESFSVYNAASPTDVDSFCSALDVSPQQRDTIKDYFGKLHALLMDVASKVGESLGLAGCSFKDWSCQARVGYTFTSGEDIGRVLAPLHTDNSFFTVLQGDECAGDLQIVDANGNFVDVDPLPGALFVNMGDVGKVWTNGRLKPVKHRVVCKKVMTRFAINLLLLPPKDGCVETEPAFIDADHPKLYRRFIYNDYRNHRNKCDNKISDEVLTLFAAPRGC